MRIETIKVYKGSKNVTIDKTDEALAEWNEMGYFTSSQRKKMKENKDNGEKGEAEENEETDVDPESADVQGEDPENNESLEGEELDPDIKV